MVYFWIGLAVCGIPALLFVICLVYLIINLISLKKINNRQRHIDIDNVESLDISNYQPAIMGYLVNNQKLTKREILSTLFDLVSRKVLKINMVEGLVNDNVGKYTISLNEKDNNLTEYEKDLIEYLFYYDNSLETKQITEEELEEKFYKNNLSYFYSKQFFKHVQEDAKKYDFFDAKTAEKKVKIYNFIKKAIKFIVGFVTIVFGIPALISGAVMFFVGSASGFILRILEIFKVVTPEFTDKIYFDLIGFPLILVAIVWLFCFLIAYLYNITCYVNNFSDNGRKEYVKWMKLKKYLEKFSLIKDQPIMGVEVWGKYYAYSIELKCSKKFFEQLKAMGIVENSLNIGVLEFIQFLEDTCDDSIFADVKSISIDEHGGSHVDYE